MTTLAAVCAFASMAGEEPLVFVAGYDNTVTCFSLDEASGKLTELSKSDCGKNPTYMAWHPSRKFIYAANENSPGMISAYSIDPKDGKLTKLNEVSSGGNGPCHIVVHPDGKWVFAGNYGSGHIGIVPLKPDCSFGTPLDPVLGGKNAHQIVIDPSGKFLLVPFLGTNVVNQYAFDEATGKLTPVEPANAAASALKAGPRHLALHPGMKYAYVINEHGSTIDRFEYNKEKGVLSSPLSVPTLPPGTDLKGKSTAHIVVSSDGKFVYGSNRGHDSIAIYAVNAADGTLTFIAHETAGGEIKTPRDFSLDLTGKYCIVASQGANYVTVFSRDAATGKLEKIGKYTVAPKPSFVGVMARP